ncbi:MAG: phosphatidylglycerol:prolipoprotein diacylglycerol transferase [Cyclobacteriaceae bacterium]|jgi:phosphatidylglycerol:prolipoprotein diacylglycerol transferase
MYPILFDLGSLSIHTYGFMIMLGALFGYLYMSYAVKKDLGIDSGNVQTLAIWIIFAAFVGGKLFFYFERPEYYFNPPSNMLKSFRQGFVFYGSLIFAVPVAIWFFRKNKWPVWAFMDRLAIAATIVHIFGRMGCFFAGCCYGLPTDKAWGVAFTDELSQAKPLGAHLHPTQLYEVLNILIIMVVLFMFKRHKRFEGQLFFIYVILYSIGRSIVEIYRGDLRRGFIIEDILSHSQFIALLLIAATLGAYRYFSQRSDLKVK